MTARLVLLHGFAQTGRSWEAVARDLTAHTGSAGTDIEVFCPDVPGHAERPHPERDLWEVATTIATECGQATYVGYSMGARLALHVALARPDLVERLVLLGGTPGIRDTHERRQRIEGDEALARSIETDGVPAFVERWLANPLFAGLTPDTAMRADRLRNTPEGLATSLRRCGTGRQDDLWPRLGDLHMPVLVMAGALDTKFAVIAREMTPRIGSAATLELVPDAGHSAHLERRESFVALLSNWLVRTG